MKEINIHNDEIASGNVQEYSPFILSVCIPTYNRASVLNECLKNIVVQKAFDNRTEIVIVDNNSTDDTAKIVEKYVLAYTNIAYYKNVENIGMEKNIICALQHGKGKLLKLWNDYSLFAENKLEELLAIIDSYKSEDSMLFFYNKLEKQPVYNCDELNSFFRKTYFWPTWIGTFSIWKSDFEKIKDKPVFEGLLFPHLLIFLEVFKTKKKIAIIYGLFFDEIKGTKKGGYNFFEVFVQNFIGKIIQKAYQEKRINLYTLYVVKSSFVSKFLNPWVKKIFFEKNHSFNRKNISLLFTYFKYYPQLYVLLWDLLFYRVVRNVKNLKKSF